MFSIFTQTFLNLENATDLDGFYFLDFKELKFKLLKFEIQRIFDRLEAFY